jgi:hypothetical protein
MPWYLITWYNQGGKPQRRELLERWDDEKIWLYVRGRIDRKTLPVYSHGVYFDAAPDSLIWNWESDEPAKASAFPIEIPEMLMREHGLPDAE